MFTFKKYTSFRLNAIAQLLTSFKSTQGPLIGQKNSSIFLALMQKLRNPWDQTLSPMGD